MTTSTLPQPQPLTLSSKPRDLSRYLENAGPFTLASIMASPLKTAIAALIFFRVRFGFVGKRAKLLGANHKLQLSTGDKVLATGLSLLPAGLSGRWNTCRWKGSCEGTCLEGAGQGGLSGMPTRARGWRTAFLAEQPLMFFRVLVAEIDSLVKTAAKKGMTPALRLNVLSDLRFEIIAPEVIAYATSKGVKVYDYTKGRGHRDLTLCDSLGYDLSFSVDERTSDEEILTLRRPVIVFAAKKGHLPTSYLGREVIDGDLSDARFLDSPDVIVGLAYKRVTRKGAGTLKEQLASAVASGFVREA